MADPELTPEEAEGIAYLESLMTEEEAKATLDRVLRHHAATIRLRSLEAQIEAEEDLERVDEMREEIERLREARTAA